MANATKQALEASLKRLLLKKPLDKITINDLARDCGISRNTFYYHFRDIYDLVEWASREDAEQALAGCRASGAWQESLARFFQLMLDNKPFIMNAYRSVSREQVEAYLHKVLYGLLLDVVERRAEGMNVAEADKQFIAHFYKYAFAGLLLDWIRDGMREEPNRLVARLDLLTQGNLLGALRRFSGAPQPVSEPPRSESESQRRSASPDATGCTQCPAAGR